MPKETIRRLAEDASRLLVAGAHLAAGDPELQKNKTALDGLARQLGDRAPVLGKLADAAGRVLAGKDAGELVSLAANLAQVRAAHAELAPAAGASAPLPPALPLGTPCSAHDLYDLHRALTESGSGREEILRNALVRNDIADLRLAESALKALGDPYLGDKAEKELLPRFGKALLGPIRRDFDPKGGMPDARRMRVLAALDPDQAGELVRRSLAEGNAPVRQAAFGVVARQFPGQPEFFPQVLEAVRKERSGDVRNSALRALATYATDEALDTLVAALDREQGSDLAVDALKELRHPQVVPRLLREFDAEQEARSKRKPAKGKEQEDAARAAKLLEALSAYSHPEVIRRGLSLLAEFGAPAATAASHSDNPADLARIADLLQAEQTELFGAAVRAAQRLGPEESYKRFGAVLSSKDRNSGSGEARIDAVAGAVATSSDKRWDAVLLDIVQADLGLTTGTRLRSLLGGAKPKPGRGTVQVINLIARRGDKSALKPFFEALSADPPPAVEIALAEAIGGLGDPSSLEALIDRAKATKDSRVMWPLHQAILRLAEPATVGKIRTIVATVKDGAPLRHYWTSLQQNLERKFPGQ